MGCLDVFQLKIQVGFSILECLQWGGEQLHGPLNLFIKLNPFGKIILMSSQYTLKANKISKLSMRQL